MAKKETAAEANRRIMEKFRNAPKGMGELIGRYEPIDPGTAESGGAIKRERQPTTGKKWATALTEKQKAQRFRH